MIGAIDVGKPINVEFMSKKLNSDKISVNFPKIVQYKPGYKSDYMDYNGPMKGPGIVEYAMKEYEKLIQRLTGMYQNICDSDVLCVTIHHLIYICLTCYNSAFVLLLQSFSS